MAKKSLDGELTKERTTFVDKFGRPSKLTDQMIARGWEYLTTIMSIAPTAGGLLPTKEGLADYLDVHKETMDDWAKKDSDFSDVLRSLERKQADRLVQYGLIGKYNPVIAKLILSKHGYVEKQEVDNHINLVQPIVGGLAKAELDDGDEQSD